MNNKIEKNMFILAALIISLTFIGLGVYLYQKPSLNDNKELTVITRADLLQKIEQEKNN